VDSDSEHTSRPLVRIRLSPIVAAAADELAEAGVASPRVDAELIAAHVLEVSRGRLALIESLRPDQLHRFTTLVAERARRIPLQHLLGTAAFRHLELAVGDGVFVPRPETELLAGWGIDRTPPGGVVADLCSGTGAIALSVADESRAARVIAVERSPVALDYLRRNAIPFPSVEVADHDPAEAVFGGADGLAVIRPVIGLAAALLKPGGVVGIEHDDVHGDAVPSLLRADGRFDEVTAHRDYSGRPRFATARRR